MRELEVNVAVYDPWADYEEVKQEYGIELENPVGVTGSSVSGI